MVKENGFNLFISNSLHDFVRSFPHYFQNEDLFANNQIIVVQNENIANWLKITLADDYGIAMQVNCLFPEEAIRQLLEHFLDPAKLLYLDEMRMLLEVIIGNLPPKHPLSIFIQNSSPTNKAATRRIFQIAKRLAILFHRYNHNLLNLPLAWIEGELLLKEKNPLPPHLAGVSLEKWQKEIWQEIFLKKSNENKFNCLLQLEQDIQIRPPKSPLPRITILGTAFLSAVHIRLFSYFAKFTQVNKCLFSPLNLDEGQNLPLLAKNWGRLLLDNYQYLTAQTEIPVRAYYHQYGAGDILGVVKNLLAGNKNKASELNFDLIADFSTFRVIGCPGRGREIEILKNKIVSLLEKEPDLKLHEIGVMALDINRYRFFIESIFAKNTDHPFIPHNIVDLSYDSNNALLNGYQSILNLAGSSFHIDEIEKLLYNAHIRTKLDISEETIGDFIALAKDLNIVWGLDQEHRRQLKKGREEHNTWQQGLNRVLGGHYYQKDGIESPSSSFDKYFSSAYSILNRELEATFLKITSLLNDLYLDTRILADLNLTMASWVEFSKELINEYLANSYAAREMVQEKRLFAVFVQLMELANKADNPLINFQSFKLNWEEQINQKSVHRGAYLTEGITFSSLKPMRSIPFKHIFLLGMNEKDFPREATYSQMDLSPYLSPRASFRESLIYDETHLDTFSFLETLFCAQKSFSIFYHHKDLLNHNPLKPTPLALQIVDLLANTFSRENKSIWKNIHESHPLHSYDPLYFSPARSRGLENYSAADYQAALALTGQKNRPLIPQSAISPQAALRESLDLEDLLNLFISPAGLFFKKGLGVAIYHHLRQVEEREKTELPYFLWLNYLKELPHTDLKFKDFVFELQEKGFITGNHFDEMLRGQAETLTQACEKAFAEMGLMERRKHTYHLFPANQKISNHHILASPPFAIGDKQVFVTGSIDFYEGNIFFEAGKKNEKIIPNSLKAYLQSLIFSASQGGGEGGDKQKNSIYTLVAFNPYWKTKAVSIEISLSPQKAKKALSHWLELYYSHLQKPLPLYFSPLWEHLKYPKENEGLPPFSLEKEIKKYFANKDNQEKYRFEALFTAFKFPDLPWEKIKLALQPLLYTKQNKESRI